MIPAGVALFLLAALWEASIYLRGAWPTAATWALMILGIAMIAVGTRQRRPRIALIAWSTLGVFLLGLLLLWASG